MPISSASAVAEPQCVPATVGSVAAMISPRSRRTTASAPRACRTTATPRARELGRAPLGHRISPASDPRSHTSARENVGAVR